MLAFVRSAPLRVSLVVVGFLVAAVVGAAIVLHNHDLVIRGVELRSRQGG